MRKAHIEEFKPMFVFAPDTKITVHPIKFGSGDWTCVTGVISGTFSRPMPTKDGKAIPPTGKGFKLNMVTVGHWKNEKMIEELLFWDNQEFISQIIFTSSVSCAWNSASAPAYSWCSCHWGWTYVTDGKFDQAQAVYQRSMKLAEDTHDDAGLTSVLQNLAVIYQKTNRLSEAEAAITRALNLAAQLPKPMNRQWAGVALTAASIYEQSSRPQQAEQIYGRVISFLEQEVGADAPALRLPLDKMVAMLKSQRRFGEAAK